jgi:alpha-ketoglutarate-dependent taurine dioxygenase
MNSVKNLLPGWGTEAEISVQSFLGNPEFWRNKLYERKLLVFRGWENLSVGQLWEVHNAFGIPWSKTEYYMSREFGMGFEEDSDRSVTRYGTKVSARVGLNQMPWHRDIPWHREIKYPIRSLAPVALENQNTPTLFCDAEVLSRRLPDNRVLHLHFMELDIVDWYAVIERDPAPEHKRIALMEEHPVTKRMVPMLNSFLRENSSHTFGARLEGAWIHNVLLYDTPVGLDHMQEFHELVCTEDNTYTHHWRTGDLVLFDNASGLMHRRPKVQPVNPELPIEREFFRMNVKHRVEAKSL